MIGRRASLAYGLASLTYAAAIFWESSLPRVSFPQGGATFSLATNLFHVPLFAALGFFLFMSLSGGRRGHVSPRPAFVALAVGALYAALDEWHQAYVPGRTAAVSDFLLDVAGVVGMLVLLSLESRLEDQR